MRLGLLIWQILWTHRHGTVSRGRYHGGNWEIHNFLIFALEVLVFLPFQLSRLSLYEISCWASRDGGCFCGCGLSHGRQKVWSSTVGATCVWIGEESTWPVRAFSSEGVRVYLVFWLAGGLLQAKIVDTSLLLGLSCDKEHIFIAQIDIFEMRAGALSVSCYSLELCGYSSLVHPLRILCLGLEQLVSRYFKRCGIRCNAWPTFTRHQQILGCRTFITLIQSSDHQRTLAYLRWLNVSKLLCAWLEARKPFHLKPGVLIITARLSEVEVPVEVLILWLLPDEV